VFKNFFASITHNAISLIGTALALATLVLMASLFTMQQFGFEGGPYLGILTYLILPMIFADLCCRLGSDTSWRRVIPSQITEITGWG